MNKLDDLFRRSHENARPATPPPGQWERIRSGKTALPPERKKRGFVPGLLLGVLLGLIPFFAFRGTGDVPACPDTAVRENVAPATPPATPPATQTVVHYDTIYRERVRTVYIASAPRLSPTSRVAAVAPTVVSADPVTANEDVKTESVITKGNRATSGLALLSTPTLEGWSAEYELRNSLAQRMGRALQAIAAEPMRAKGQWKRFTAVPDSVNPKGTWEFGIHVTPEIDGGVAIVDLYSAEPNNLRDPKTFNIGGEERELYYYGTDNIDGRNALRPLLTHLEVARQFGNGLRLGAGLGILSSRRYVPEREELLPLLFEGEYYTYRGGKSEDLFLTLSAGYTFRRRKRLQYSLGVSLFASHISNNYTYESIFSRDERRSYGGEYRDYSIREYFYNYTILPQLDIQYHLSKRFSVGLEIMPGIGVGGRLKL